jgi:hypothetical protein
VPVFITCISSVYFAPSCILSCLKYIPIFSLNHKQPSGPNKWLQNPLSSGTRSPECEVNNTRSKVLPVGTEYSCYWLPTGSYVKTIFFKDLRLSRRWLRRIVSLGCYDVWLSSQHASVAS